MEINLFGDIHAAIAEEGCGFPDVGDYVSDGSDVYLVVTAGSRITTGVRRGDSNICHGYIVRSASWGDFPEDELFPATVIVDLEDFCDGATS